MDRFQGTIQLGTLGYAQGDFGKIASALIGRGGSGIKALTARFPGLYVKIYDSRRGLNVRCPASDCNSIHISAVKSVMSRTSPKKLVGLLVQLWTER